jgi:hypothetical protein
VVHKAGTLALFIWVGILSQSVLWAQGNTASLWGNTADEQHLRLPGVSLTLHDAQGGLKRSLVSGPEGTFEFLAVPPGEYTLTAERASFQSSQVNLTLEVNQRARVDVIMAVASQSETVQVTAAVPLLHTTEAVVGEVIDKEHVSQLPLNGRQFLELSMLVPGVHDSHGAQKGSVSPLYWRPGQNSAISVSGGRPNSNTYLLDGTVNTDPSFNTYIISLAPDVIREFQIETGTYSAEMGGAGTGQVNVVTKSGGNQIHGSAYEFFRNDVLDARLFTSPDKLPHFSQNQFGGTVGGPIQKDRTFYFLAYEAFRSVEGQSNIMSVPTAAERTGDFGGSAPIFDPASAGLPRAQFQNNQIPADRINPIARRVLAELVPLPNLLGGSNNLLDTRLQRLSSDQGNLRLDHILAGGTSLFGRYSVSAERGYTPQNLPGFGAFHDNRVQNLTLAAIQPFSPTLVGEYRAGLTRMVLHRYGEKAFGTDWISVLGIPGVGFGGPEAYGLPNFNVQGYDPLGDSLLCTPCKYFNTMFQGGAKLTWVHANHSLRFGGDVDRFRWNMLGFFQNRGYFQFSPGFTTRTASNDGTGNGLASFLLGLPVIAQRQAGYPDMHLRQTFLNLYAQDDWRVTSHLTLNLGVRYELRTPLQDAIKQLTNLTWDTNGVPSAYLSGQNGFPEGLAFTDKNNFAPRVGIAYSPAEGKYVFRAGYGMFYSYPDMNLWCNQVHNVPLVFPEGAQSDNFTPAITRIGFNPPVLGQTRTSFTALDPHAKTPYIQQASLTIERKLGEATMVQIGYLGAWAKKLDRSRLANNAVPAAGALQPRRRFQTIQFLPGTVLPSEIAPGATVLSLNSPVSAINLLENSASSSYNSGWVLLKRKFSNGLSFLSSYTFAKSLTDAPAFRSPAMESEVPQNSSDLRSEWGLAGCDITHRWVTSLIYKIPFSMNGQRISGVSGLAKVLVSDWQISVIYQAQSGFPFTAGVFGDTANAGSLLNVNPVRADVVAGVSPILDSSRRSTDEWFNTDAFRTPAAFTFGTAGRNTLRGPGMQKGDLALERKFSLREQTQLGFRAEVFNVFNHTNFDTPERFVNTPQFGTVTMAATSARQIQFALRLEF